MGVYGCSSVATSIFAFVRFGISTTKLSKVPSPSSPEEERNGMSCHGDIWEPPKDIPRIQEQVSKKATSLSLLQQQQSLILALVKDKMWKNEKAQARDLEPTVLPVLSEKKIRYSRDSDCPSSLVENSLLLLLMLPPREAILLASVSSAEEEEEEDFSLGDGQRHNDAKALFSLRK